MGRFLLQKLLNYILRNKAYLEISEFEGDIFCLQNMAFSIAAVKTNNLQITIYPKELKNEYISIYDTKKYNEFAKTLYGKYQNKPLEFKKLFYRARKNLLEACLKLSGVKTFNKEIYKNFIKAVQEFANVSCFSLEALEDYLKEQIQAKVPNKDRLELLTVPFYTSYIQKRDAAILRFLKNLPREEIKLLKRGESNLNKYKKLPKILNGLLEKWHWSFYNYGSQKKFSLKNLLKYVIKNLKDIKKQAKTLGSIEKKRARKKKYLKTTSPTLRRLIKFFDLLVEMRDQRKATWLQTIIPQKKWTKMIGKNYGFAYNQARFLTYKEQLILTKNNVKKFAKMIDRRKKGCADIFGFNKKGSIIVTGIDYKKLSSAVLSRQKSNILKGIPVSTGKVTGQVKNIAGTKDFKNFNEGEILVASHTTPEYAAIMKKAKAILTERGGITSHAAILSRELKKPCVVGIKGLFGNFRDGDLVEIDAEKGVVKIIKR